MDTSCKRIIWQQFGAAIEMLDNGLRPCPDELWHGRLWDNPQSSDYSQFWYVELPLYSMRHVQEHAAQLNLFLGQNGVAAPGWITKARN
jgi:hypothetical protein